MIHCPPTNAAEAIKVVVNLATNTKRRNRNKQPIHVNDTPARPNKATEEIQKEVRTIDRVKGESLYMVHTRRQKMAD